MLGCRAAAAWAAWAAGCTRPRWQGRERLRRPVPHLPQESAGSRLAVPAASQKQEGGAPDGAPPPAVPANRVAKRVPLALPQRGEGETGAL